MTDGLVDGADRGRSVRDSDVIGSARSKYTGMSALIGVELAQKIFEETKPYLLRDRSTALVTLDEIDQVLRSPDLTRQDLRLLFKGEPVPSFEFESLSGRIDQRAVWDLFSQGRSIAFHQLDRRIPTLGRLCNQMAREIQGPAWVNLYISPPGQGAFRAHRDDHHVLVSQISGVKTWRLESDVTVETWQCAKECIPRQEDFQVAQGDLLLVPMGVQHEACSDRDVSVHLTLGFRRQTWQEQLHRAVDALGRESQRPALAPGQPGFSKAMEAILFALRETLNRASRTSPNYGGLEGEIQSLSLTGISVLVGTQGHGFVARREGEALVLSDERRVVRVPIVLEPMMWSLLEGSEVAVSELSEILDEGGWRKVASILIREGIAVAR